ncbi:hypothetical protein QQ045_003054 [Rhodiola kirilowii]
MSRLPTKDRLKGTVHGGMYCCWCNTEAETVEHLFLKCYVLKPIFSFLEILEIFVCWNSFTDMVDWLNTHAWRSNAEKKVAYFILNAVMYETWRARNMRIFLEDSASTEDLKRRIGKLILYKIELIRNSKADSIVYNWLVDNNLVVRV